MIDLKMTPKELEANLIKAAMARLPMLIVSPPGCGKSSICSQVAEKLGMDFFVETPVISDVTDAKGGLLKVDDHYEWGLVGQTRLIVNATKPTLVLIDDLIQAPPSVQAAYMQWILLRQIGDKKIPDCVTIFAATNRREDKAGGKGILEPVQSRFNAVYELVPDAHEWIEWAYQNNMPSSLIGYVFFRPEAIHDNIATLDLVRHSCPRTLAKLGENINAGLDDIKNYCCAIGEGRGQEYAAFKQMFESLPNIIEAIENPTTEKLPTELSARCATVTAMADRVTKDNFDNIATYCKRMGDKFYSFAISACTTKKPKLVKTKTYTDWAIHVKQKAMV